MTSNESKKAPWWIWGLVVLAAGLAVISWLRPHKKTLGEEFEMQLEKAAGGGERLRDAIPMLDYTIDQNAVKRFAETMTERGAGDDSLGQGKTLSKWTRGSTGNFTWHRAAENEEPLRAALADDGVAMRAVVSAAAAIALGGDDPRGRAAFAASPLDALTDQQLFERWLAADRAMLLRLDDLDKVLVEGLLLVATPENFVAGAVVVFSSHDWEVYILGGDERNGIMWVPLEAYDRAGRLLWRGQLRLEGDPDTATVRAAAAWGADEVYARDFAPAHETR